MHELQINLSGVTQIVPTTRKIIDYCRLVGFDYDTCFQIHVVVTEAINNIITYATPDSPITISCMFDELDKVLVIDIIDNGTAIDKLPLFEFPDCEAESGRGWPIIINWMDDVSHVRQGEENHLSMKKYLI